MLSKYLCEFVGVFVLVFTVVCNVCGNTSTMGPTSIACSLMVMIYAVSSVSGGRLNPAVSLALALAGKFDWLSLPGYWVSQLAGGLVAGFAASSSFSSKVANVQPVAPFASSHAFVAELIYTFMLSSHGLKRT